MYLDYAAGTPAHTIQDSTPTPNPSLKGRWTTQFGNPSSIHSPGVEARSKLNEARRTLAKVLNCYDYEVYFMPNSTYSIATALTAGRDGTIITSNIEHPAILENLNKKSETNEYDNDKNIILKVEENGILKGSSLREALNKIEILKNKEKILVTIMYANNEIGTIQKVKEYGRIIDEYNRKNNLNADNRVLYHIDASQASNYLDLDVKKLRCDMLTLNSSKCYGPRGMALLYIKEDTKHRVHPLMRGGNQERGMYSGTENVAGAIGFAEALTYVQSIKEEEGLRLCALRDTFIQMYTDEMWERRSCGGGGCSSCVCGERLIYGTTEVNERLPNNINIRVPGVPSDEMVIRLDQKGFAVSHRSACATAGRTSPEEERRRAANDLYNKDSTDEIDLSDGYVLKAIGASDEESNENIRISMGLYTTMDDMMNLLTAILEIYDKYSICK